MGTNRFFGCLKVFNLIYFIQIINYLIDMIRSYLDIQYFKYLKILDFYQISDLICKMLLFTYYKNKKLFTFEKILIINNKNIVELI